MRVTVCELNDEPGAFARDWADLVTHVRHEGSDLVLLPELGCAPWFPAARDFDERTWQAAVAEHAAWLRRLPELAPALVLGTCPVEIDGRRLNEAFVWDAERGYRAAHHKYYLPDEDGFWEASWYERGDGSFEPIDCGPARAGFVICTELWFMQQARVYGQRGAHLLVNPRTTAANTVEKWLLGGRAAAVISGAYCISSNRVNAPGAPVGFGGLGWIVGPDGDVLGLTSREGRFATCDIDLRSAERAKAEYPRYVRD